MSGSPSRDRFPILAFLGILILSATTALLPMAGARDVEVDRERIAAADLAYGEALAASDAEPGAARAKFAAAAEAFALADPSRRSAGAIYNEANARLQAGEIGAAIAGYRLARSLDPGNPRIEANLGEARRKVIGSIGLPEPTTRERLTRLWAGVSERTRWATAIALLWAAVVLRALSRRAFPALLTALVLSALVGSTVVIDLVGRANSRHAVLADASLMRKGNGDGFEPMLAEPLPAGTECRILEQRPGWTEIEIAGRTRGWVRNRSVKPVEPVEPHAEG